MEEAKQKTTYCLIPNVFNSRKSKLIDWKQISGCLKTGTEGGMDEKWVQVNFQVVMEMYSVLILTSAGLSAYNCQNLLNCVL